MNPEVRKVFEKRQLEELLEQHKDGENSDLFGYLSPENQETFLDQGNASTISALLEKARSAKARNANEKKRHTAKTRKALKSLRYKANTRRGYLMAVEKPVKSATSQRNIHKRWFTRHGYKP